jgi:hypothetical protein
MCQNCRWTAFDWKRHFTAYVNIGTLLEVLPMLIYIDYPSRRLLLTFASTAGQKLTMMPIDAN